MNFSNKYREPDYFSKLQSSIKPKSLSIFYHNVCSLSKIFDQLHALMTKLNIDFDFIGITKSRIWKINFSPTNIENYTIKQKTTESSAEGVFLHISRKYSNKIRKSLIIKKENYTSLIKLNQFLLKHLYLKELKSLLDVFTDI